jgi:hypothetical protein
MIRLIEGNAKSPRLKSNLEKDFAAAFYLSQAPSPQAFFFGWSSSFVDTESGPIQSVIVLQYMVSNTTQHPPSPPHTLYIYLDPRGGGGGV